MARIGSFPYLLIIAGLGAIAGAVMWISTDPFMQQLFTSDFHTSTTTEGQAALSWGVELWGALMAIVLFAILFELFIRTRRESRT